MGTQWEQVLSTSIYLWFVGVVVTIAEDGHSGPIPVWCAGVCACQSRQHNSPPSPPARRTTCVQNPAELPLVPQ
ncbi:hypothetical protein J6590_015231 [Homalodisca vitripennis]|nr:hypothetical protein J6590_015231 [Homalodisca vitripennis]